MTVSRAMLMAAGLGTRLRPFTDNFPKALVPVLGVPIAQFAVDAAIRAGVTRVVANVHHHADLAEVGLLALERGSRQLVISDERQALLGSGGGIRHALDQLGPGAFYYLNADVLMDIDLAALARAHERLRARWGVTLTLTVFPRAPGPGRYREIHFDPQSSLVTRLGEPATGRAFFASAAVIESESLRSLPDAPFEFVSEILAPAIAAGKCGVHLASGLWYDIGSPELWLKTHLELLERLETGRLPAYWRERIEKHNRRLTTGIWISAGAGVSGTASKSRPIGWAGPSYWSPGSDRLCRPPERLGPRAILYGSARNQGPGDGIGFGGSWVSVPESPLKAP